MIAPRDYLRQYVESFQLPETESSLPPDGSGLMLERGYYYPPYLKLEAYLDTLSRADLLEIVQQVFAIEYPQQSLVRRQVGEYLETLQRLKDERAWRQAETKRLNAELAWRVEAMADLEAERKRLELLAIDGHAELENGRNQIAALESERAMLRASLDELWTSTSWKVTAPLRRVSRAVKALRASGD